MSYLKLLNQSPEIKRFRISRKRNFPNSLLDVIIYKSACVLPQQKNNAADIMQKIFLRNDWSNSWRNGIYDFHHYHSITHEVMGICSGEITVVLGGPGGKQVSLVLGDVIILPAGVGHKCLHASGQFLCVGAYPQGKEFDIKLGKSSELKSSIENIKKPRTPSTDPVYGKLGFLKTFWQ